MSAASLFALTPFADWVLNTALYTTLILLTGRLLLLLARKASAPFLSGLCLALMAVLLTVPIGSIVLSAKPNPISGITQPQTRPSLFDIGNPDGVRPGNLEPTGDDGQAASKADIRSSSLGKVNLVFYYSAAVLNVLGIIWLTGFIISLGRLLTGIVNLSLFRRSLNVYDSTSQEEISRILTRYFPKTRIPAILTSPIVDSPMTCGLFNPVIILHPSLASRCGPREIKNILVHEMSHIHHRDLLFGYLQRIMTAFYWWNPLALHLSRVFSRSREEIGDNHAIQASGPLEFAQSLAVLAEQIGEVRKAPACPALTTSRQSLEERIRRILSGRNGVETKMKKSIRMALLAAAGLTVLIILQYPWVLAARQNDQVAALLTGIKKPTSITVDGSEIFITEEESVSIYSLEDYSLIRRFGKLGDNPGDFRFRPHLTAYPNHLLVGNMGKLSLFTREGDFIEEKTIPFTYFYMYYPMLPVGDKHVGFNLKKNNREEYVFTGILYDTDFNPIKEFYEGGPPQLLPPPKPGTQLPGKVEYEPIFDCLDVAVYEDRIYVADTRKGFHIEVYDQEAYLLSTIHKNYEKIEVPQILKDEYMENVRRAPDSEDLLNRFNYKFRAYFPAFFSFKIRDGKMYFTTYAQEDGRFELVETDMQGKVLDRSFVFPLHPLRRLSSSLNSYTADYDLRRGSLYYLEKAPGAQDLLLHRIDLN